MTGSGVACTAAAQVRYSTCKAHVVSLAGIRVESLPEEAFVKKQPDFQVSKTRNGPALEALQQAIDYVRQHPDVDSLVVMASRPGHCIPFTTPIDRPLDFIGMLELMKHDIFREK